MDHTRTDTEGQDAAQPNTRLPRWRRILVGVLVVLGCVLAPLSLVGVWIHGTLLDTDRYVDTVGPLASNPDVQQALATRVSRAIVERTDLEGTIADALPSKAGFIAPAVADRVQQFVYDEALKLVKSDTFQTLWDAANRRAHTQLVKLLRGEDSGRIENDNGEVYIRIGPFATKVMDALEHAGIDVFSNVDTTGPKSRIVLLSSEQLKQLQSLTKVLDSLAVVLPILTLVFFAAAIALSGNRRRTVLRSALGVALGMGLLLVLFNVGRRIYLDALPSGVNTAAAAAVYDQLLSFLRLALRTSFLLAIVIALAAWLAGPGKLATRVRTSSTNMVRGHPNGAEPSPVGAWVARHRVPLRVLVIGVALAVIAVLSAPTPATVIVLAVLVVVALALIEFLGRSATVPTQSS